MPRHNPDAGKGKESGIKGGRRSPADPKIGIDSGNNKPQIVNIYATSLYPPFSVTSRRALDGSVSIFCRSR